MSPLVFLAIAAVVPLIGMIVLGTAARIKRARISDDDSEPFRRRLANLAPKGAPGPSAPGPRAPGPMGGQPTRLGEHLAVPQPPRTFTDPPTSSIRLIERGVVGYED